MQESVRISDGVVVGVDKLLSVLLLHLRGIVWLEESGTPVKAEVLYRERRILSMDVKNFTLQ